jgi:hypothetical protein
MGICFLADRLFVVKVRKYRRLGELALEAPRASSISVVGSKGLNILSFLPPFNMAVMGPTILKKLFMKHL